MRRRWLAVLAAAICALAVRRAAAAAAPEVLAVLVGADEGLAGDEPLRYAASDARRVRDALVELGGLRSERALLVLGRGPEHVLRALREAQGRAAELAASGRPVHLVFYYAGHGTEDALSLPGGPLPLGELRRALGAVPARLRLVLLDSCRSGGRGRGVRRGPAFALALSPEGPEGVVELRSASRGESAQESDSLGGALFTHYLLSGLRGAADGDRDGQVTLAELYAYAYGRTLLRSGLGPGLQHPTADLALQGAGEVVLSRPGAGAATIVLPEGEGTYLVFSVPGAQVLGERPGPGALALPAGRYLVLRRQESRTAVATVDLSWGGTRRLAARDFRPVAREELGLRGGALELRPRRLEARGGAEIGIGGVVPIAVRATLGGAYERGRLGGAVELGYAGGAVATAGLTGWSDSLVGAAGLRARLLLGPVGLTAEAGVELRYSLLRLQRRDAERAAAAGLPTDDSRALLALGPRAGLHLLVPLGHHLSLMTSAWLAALFQREEPAPGADAVIGVRPVAQLTMGLSHAF